MIIKINNWLYQGDYLSVAAREYKNYPTVGIIAVNENNEKVFPEPGNDINYLWCAFNDPGETLTPRKLVAMRRFAEALKEEGGILVHCYGGVNRSSAICVYLLSTLTTTDSHEACRLVKERNPHMQIRPELIEVFRGFSGIKLINP